MSGQPEALTTLLPGKHPVTQNELRYFEGVKNFFPLLETGRSSVVLPSLQPSHYTDYINTVPNNVPRKNNMKCHVTPHMCMHAQTHTQFRECPTSVFLISETA